MQSIIIALKEMFFETTEEEKEANNLSIESRKVEKSREKIIWKNGHYTPKEGDNRCPDCRDPKEEYYNGPEGGMSVNILCANERCHSYFNSCFDLERIRWINHYFGHEKQIEFCPHIIENWHLVDFHPEIDFRGPANRDDWDDMFKWCEKNCKGNWSVKSDKFYFQLQDDGVHFGLKWL